MFARTWSFSPLDKPFDLFTLDPRIDRHVAQKNLNFVPQATPYRFNVVHLPNAFETIEFRPLTKDALMALQHPALLDLKVRNITNNELLMQVKPELAGETVGKISMENTNGQWQMKAAGRRGPGLDKQAGILKETEAIIQSVNAGRSSIADHKKQLDAFSSMHQYVEQTAFQLNIPDFDLKKGEAVGFDIVNTNQVNGQMKGWITIIVMR
jgi:hypothetical protein